MVTFPRLYYSPSFRASPIASEEVEMNSGGHLSSTLSLTLISELLRVTLSKWWGQRWTLAFTLRQLYHSPSLQSYDCLWVSDVSRRWTQEITLPQLYHSPSLQSFSDCPWWSDGGRDELWRSPFLNSITHPHYRAPVFHSTLRTLYSDHIFSDENQQIMRWRYL